MYNIETLYSSYQELLLDLDIYGRLMESQSLDDKEAFKELLFQEYAKAHPIPTLESRDYELSEPVSAEYHVSYMHELELSQNEEVINFDDDEDDDEDSQEDIDIEDEDLSLPSDFPRELFIKPVSVEERDNILATNKYFATVSELDDFTGDIAEVESNFGAVVPSEESVFIEEPVQVDEDVGDSDDIYDYEDDEVEEDTDEYEEQDGYSEESSGDFQLEDENYEEDVYSYDDENEEESEDSDETKDQEWYSEEDSYELDDSDFVDEVYDNPTPAVEKPRNVVVEPPPIVLPKSSQPVETEEVDRSKLPKDVLQYLREHPRCEISEVLKYYPRKELEKYIRTGRIIKKGSKVYI